MWIALVPIVLMGGGFAAWMFFFKDRVIGAAHAAWAQAQAHFDANEVSILGKYWSDENRFKPLQDAVPGETIVGITNASIPKKLGEKVMAGLEEAVTNTITFDMGSAYLILTDRTLHYVEYNGTGIVEQHSFPLSSVQSATLEVETSGPQKLSFTAAGQPQLFRVSGACAGYPRFEVDRSLAKDVLGHDRDNPFYRIYKAEDAELGEMGPTLDQIVRRKYSKGFIERMQSQFGIRWPDMFQI